MILSQTTLKLLTVFLTLFAGYALSKIGAKILTALYRKRHGVSIKQVPAAKTFSYIVMLIAIVLSLLFLQINIREWFVLNAYALIPEILSIVLLIILVITAVKFIMWLLDLLLRKTGIRDFTREHEKEQVISAALILIQAFLYLILGLTALKYMGFALASTTVNYVIYPLIIFFLGLAFFGTKGFAENFMAGVFLKTSKSFRIGQRVVFDGNSGIIKDMSNQGVTIETDKGSSLFVPNKKFVNSSVMYKTTTTDLDTLDKIKEHFVAQSPSYCGPASASMILHIFGYEISQEEIGKAAETKVPGGTHPETLIKVVSKLTKENVNGVWIDIHNINNLKEEVLSWLDNGALVIVDYRKNLLFPEAKSAHYSVVLAVEGDEFVILDPSSKSGGVYLADYHLLERGMNTYSELIHGKRGYIVFAPKDTPAYHRIKEGLVYSDISLYKGMNRALQEKFDKLVSKVNVAEMLPPAVKNLLKKHTGKPKIARVWKPMP